jgi:hypothetical protein
MKRFIAFFVVVAVVALVTLAAKASQDPTAAAQSAQSASAAASITITSLPASMGTLEERIQRGFAIAPVALNLKGKNVAFVGLGSYIVNAQGGCNDCHTNPPYAPGGDPFQGQPRKVNAARYLAGGMPFGPGIVSRNITPDANGLPGGLTFTEFLHVMRTGEDPEHPGELLQVMPWPVYGQMRWADLRAVYEYLRAIPSVH